MNAFLRIESFETPHHVQILLVYRAGTTAFRLRQLPQCCQCLRNGSTRFPGLSASRLARSVGYRAVQQAPRFDDSNSIGIL
jgi:hypothetical protein